jgi:protein involved in polysaccharide export with SLBB domain
MPRGSTISELLRRAGGVLPNADLRAAVFTREEIRRREVEQLKQLEQELVATTVSESGIVEGGTESVQDAVEVGRSLTQLQETQAVGRLVINLPAIIAGQTNQDVILEDGDVLVLPSIRQSVTVLGEVLFPTSHVYQASYNQSQYLEMSGGPSRRADMARAFVIRADGSVTPLSKFGSSFSLGSIASSVAIEPGDTFVIPRDVDDLPALDLWTKITQIIYQSAVTLAAVGSL